MPLPPDLAKTVEWIAEGAGLVKPAESHPGAASLVASGIRTAGYEPSPVHKEFRPDGILKLEKHEWHILATPGHSPGLVALLDPERHILFASDIDGEGPPWYGYPSSDPSELERTALMLAEIPVAIYASSHAPPRKRGIKPMLKAMAEAIRERDRLVLA